MNEEAPAPGQPKSKEEALAACAELHHALIACFKTCSFFSAFTGCCTAEHAAFWACYTAQRGRNDTIISTWVDEKLRRDKKTRDD